MRLRFGPFVLNIETNQLVRESEPVHLTAKAARLLELLLSRRPDVVSRQDIYDHLWPDVIVADGNVKNLVAEIRRAVGEKGRGGKFIRTVYHNGYAFVHPVVEESDAATAFVSLVGEGRRVLLWPGENVVGRGDDCSVVLDDARISRHHARLFVEADRVTVEDLESKNGSFLNETPIVGAKTIGDGDVVRFGPFAFQVRFSTPRVSTESFLTTEE